MSGEHLEHGGLPGPVGAHEAQDLARVQLEIHAADRRDASEGTPETPCRQHDRVAIRRRSALTWGSCSHRRLVSITCARRRPGEEDGADEVVAVDELGDRAGEHDASPLHEHRSHREPHGEIDRLLDEQHRGAVLVDLPHDLHQTLDDDRRQPERELVDHQQPGSGDERLREAQHLLLPTGEVAGGGVPPRSEDGEVRQRILGGLSDVLRFVEVGPPGDLEALGHREIGEDPAPARHLDDPEARDPIGIQAGDVLTVEDHLPGGRAGEPGDRSQECGLAGAVGAQQRDELPVLHVQVDPREHGTAVVPRVDGAQHEEAGPSLPAGPADLGVGRGGDSECLDGGPERRSRGGQDRRADEVEHRRTPRARSGTRRHCRHR